MMTIAADRITNETSNPTEIQTVYEHSKNLNLGNLSKFREIFDNNVNVQFLPTGVAATGVENVYSMLRKSWHVSDVVESEERVRLTVGSDTVVEETVITLVHNDYLGWLLPDCRITNKRIVVPMVISASFTNGKISSKRFYWDQASVLKQIGVLPTSLYSKAAGYEMVLPVVGVKIADMLLEDCPTTGVRASEHLTEAARSSESLPAGVSSKQANEPQVRKPSASSRKQTLDSVGNIISPSKNNSRVGSNASLAEQSADAPEAFRSSTRVFAKPKSNIFDSNSEPEPLHTSIPIDPRKHQNQLNLFDDTPYTPRRPARRDPNYSGDTGAPEVFRSGKKMVHTSSNSQIDDLVRGTLEPNKSFDELDVDKMHERPISRMNESHFKIEAANEAAIEAEASADRTHLLDNHKILSKANESHFSFSNDASEAESGPRRTVVKHFPNQTAFKSSIVMGTDNSEPESVRPSSRVLKAPGGGSNIILG